MNVKVENILEGAKFDGVIWDYWIDLRLPNGSLLNVFDSECLSQEIEEKSNIIVRLKALFIQKKENADLTTLKGIIIQKDNLFFFKNDLVKIQVNEDDIGAEKIPLNVLTTLFFGRIDLINFSAIGQV